jgi:CRISPR-associated protein Cas5t
MDVSLHVEVPFCAFRPYTSREYQDSYPFPPPSAVYGMLLSLVGVSREDKSQHCGVEIALAVETLPEKAKVFRKLRRGKTLEDIRPDYQDLLLNLRLWIWLQQGRDNTPTPLTEKVALALSSPASLTRSGGVSLGESSYLVDTISRKEPPEADGIFLQPNDEGFYSLPVWVDHQNAAKTILRRFALVPRPLRSGLADVWTEIPTPTSERT